MIAMWYYYNSSSFPYSLRKKQQHLFIGQFYYKAEYHIYVVDIMIIMIQETARTATDSDDKGAYGSFDLGSRNTHTIRHTQ